MTVNPINDISKIYLEQISPTSRLRNAVADDRLDAEQEKTNASMDKLRKQNKRFNNSRASASLAAKKVEGDVRKSNAYGPQHPKPGTVTARRIEGLKPTGSKPSAYRIEETEIDEANKSLDPVGREDDDVNNNGIENDESDKYILNRRRAIGVAISKKRKKNVKESFSNWRQDLSEVIDSVDRNEKIKEKKVNNKIKTSAIGSGIKLGEAVEDLGGTLIEMIEVDEFDYIVESVYGELLDEGYEEDDIEEALEYALTEAKVTFGHDTPKQEKKGRNLLGAVGRLARQKLSSKYRGAKKAASGAIASGARQVARGALGVARKMEGDKKPSSVHSKSGTRSPSLHSGEGVGRRERVSSGSYTPPKSETKTEPKKSTSVSDPWEGSYTNPPKKSAPKPQAKAKTSAETSSSKSPNKRLTAKQKAAVLRAQRRNLNISPEDLKRVADSVTEDYYDLASKSVKPGKPGEEQKKTIETLASKARTKKKTRTPVGTARRGSTTFKPSSPEEAEANKKSWGDYWSSAAKGYKEQYEILEKAESEQQQKLFGLALSVKRGQTSRDKVSDKVLEIVDSMSEKKIRDFAKTPHKGIPNKIETKEEAIRQEFIARMIEKIEEQSYVDEAKLPSSMKKGKKKVESKTQVIHDVDDNLADQRHPDAAKIDVMRKTDGSWKKVKSLTPSQFAHHKLRKPGEPVKEENDPGDKYGFDQFRDTKKFKKTTKPNKPVVRLGDSPRRPAQKSVVTARGGSEFGSKKPSTPMDKPGEFAKDLKNRIGVKNLERKNVHFTGGMRSGSGPEKKAEVVKKIAKPDAKKIITTDDHLQNVRHMASAASSVAPNAKVKAYQSRPATKAKGKVKAGDITPVRVGKERNLSDTNIGIRSNTLSSSEKTPQKTQKRKKQQKMGEELQPTTPQQFAAQKQLTMVQKKLTAADQIALQKQKREMKQKEV